MKYYIYIGNKVVTEVSGCEVAYEAYHKMCEFVDIIGETASLVDGETGEVIEHSDDWDDYDEDYEPDLEMGFDSYEGCYSFDC